MKIVFINSVQYGSTGNIALQIARKAEDEGNICYVAIPQGRHNKSAVFHNTIWIGNRLSEDFHILLGRLFGNVGHHSYFATKRFIRKLDAIKPDIIHIHNLHNSYINIPILFNYIRENQIKTVWTLHDCWAFTGHCPHYTMVKCDKWKSGCNHCPQYREYPECYVDNSETQYIKKKIWFCGLKNLTLVAPSNWMAQQIKQSFLCEYPVKVINNGIDLSAFKPTKSNFREKYGLQDKYIVLGVSFSWGTKKGMDVFVRLAEILPSDYKIVLVGTNDSIDKELPENIISIHKTQNKAELAEVYSAADVFVNPTREDNYPTVNMEAIACGTPVITFRAGGSPEIVGEGCGCTVEVDDIDGMAESIEKCCIERIYRSEDCRKHAESFNQDNKFQEYIDLYRRIYDGTSKS